MFWNWKKISRKVAKLAKFITTKYAKITKINATPTEVGAGIRLRPRLRRHK